MKLHALYASAVALTLALPAMPAKADSVNRQFVALESIAWGVLQQCPGFRFIEGSARKSADKMGVDFDKYGPASLNAIFAIMDLEYDREKLIPEVTQAVRADMTDLVADLKKLGKGGFCKKFGKVMIDISWMTKDAKPAKKDEGSF